MHWTSTMNYQDYIYVIDYAYKNTAFSRRKRPAIALLGIYNTDEKTTVTSNNAATGRFARLHEHAAYVSLIREQQIDYRSYRKLLQNDQRQLEDPTSKVDPPHRTTHFRADVSIGELGGFLTTGIRYRCSYSRTRMSTWTGALHVENHCRKTQATHSILCLWTLIQSPPFLLINKSICHYVKSPGQII
jgi:hypothetical protein